MICLLVGRHFKTGKPRPQAPPCPTRMRRPKIVRRRSTPFIGCQIERWASLLWPRSFVLVLLVCGTGYVRVAMTTVAVVVGGCCWSHWRWCRRRVECVSWGPMVAMVTFFVVHGRRGRDLSDRVVNEGRGGRWRFAICWMKIVNDNCYPAHLKYNIWGQITGSKILFKPRRMNYLNRE